MRNSNIIEKAHQVGDTNAKGYVWVEYKPGKFDWRPPKHKAVVAYHQSKGQGGNNSSVDDSKKRDISQFSKDELLAWAKKTNEDVLSKIVNKIDAITAK